MINVSGWTLKAPSPFSRLVFLLLLSIGLMLADHRGHHLDRMRGGLNYLARPVQSLAVLPLRGGNAVVEFFSGKGELQENYAKLYHDHIVLLGRLQTYETLEAENIRLRELLGAAERLSVEATVAERLEVSAAPFTRKITLTKGLDAGVYVGQPIVDAYGVVGRISQVDPQTSRATLITDTSHSIPAQVVRNGLRVIVAGTGAQDEVEILYLPGSSDIQVDDTLVSSGIGGTFPAGYPVARVISVVNNPNESFLKVVARPLARLDHNKEVLLIWPDKKQKLVKAGTK